MTRVFTYGDEKETQMILDQYPDSYVLQRTETFGKTTDQSGRSYDDYFNAYGTGIGNGAWKFDGRNPQVVSFLNTITGKQFQVLPNAPLGQNALMGQNAPGGFSNQSVSLGQNALIGQGPPPQNAQYQRRDIGQNQGITFTDYSPNEIVIFTPADWGRQNAPTLKSNRGMFGKYTNTAGQTVFGWKFYKNNSQSMQLLSQLLGRDISSIMTPFSAENEPPPKTMFT